MVKNEIQEQRMRGYFIEAAKEILKGEGLKSISVRKIAERAGYSYTTLYNYFKDLNELIFWCVKDFQDECETIVRDDIKNQLPGLARIKAISHSYIKYFIQYPGIFELFYLEKINNAGTKQPTAELITTFLDRLCKEDWDYCTEKAIVSRENADLYTRQLRFSVAGLLLLYLNRMQPSDYKEFVTTTGEQIDQILSIR